MRSGACSVCTSRPLSSRRAIFEGGFALSEPPPNCGWRRRSRRSKRSAGRCAAIRASRCVVAALGVVLMAMGFFPRSSMAGLADQVGATFGLMIQDVVAAFPAVEGLVVAMEGDRIY